MPDVNWNKSTWNESYKWIQKGDEWSEAWGGADMQWYGSILPRIHKYVSNEETHKLEVGTILEIAPGYGRWTNYLKNIANNLIVVDLSEKCIEVCQKRFANFSNIQYYVNDGKSLEMIADASIDFVFSMDSLVHCEMDVINSYLEQISYKLTTNGVGFFHHSNMGSYFDHLGNLSGNISEQKRLYGRPMWNRGKTVNSESVREACKRNKMKCLSQETINWSSSIKSVDCLSIFSGVYSHWSNSIEYEKLDNISFMTEAHRLKQLSKIYG